MSQDFQHFFAQNIFVETKKFAKPFLHVCMGQRVESFKAKKILKKSCDTVPLTNDTSRPDIWYCTVGYMILYGTCYIIQVAWQHDIVQYSIWYTLNWHTVQYDTSVRVPDTWVQSWPDTWSRWTRWVSRQCPAPSPLLLTVCSGPSSVYRRQRSEGTNWRFRYLKVHLAMLLCSSSNTVQYALLEYPADNVYWVT